MLCLVLEAYTEDLMAEKRVRRQAAKMIKDGIRAFMPLDVPTCYLNFETKIQNLSASHG